MSSSFPVSSPVVLNSLIRSLKASSTLNSSREFSISQILDSSENCWMSGPAVDKFQQISMKFSAPIILSQVKFHFQGGFAPKLVIFRDSSSDFLEWEPSDINSVQTAKVSEPRILNSMKIVFSESYDSDYGRITIYSMELIGWPAEEKSSEGKIEDSEKV